MKSIFLNSLRIKKSSLYKLLLFILTFSIITPVFSKNILFKENTNADVRIEKILPLKSFEIYDKTKCTTKHGDKPVYILERNLRARVTRPDKNFSNWFLFDDQFNAQKFFGSFSIRPRGDEAVSSMILKLKSNKDKDLKKFYYKPGSLNPGEHICDLNIKNISCRVYVHPDSHTGKTLAVKLRGKIETN